MRCFVSRNTPQLQSNSSELGERSRKKPLFIIVHSTANVAVARCSYMSGDHGDFAGRVKGGFESINKPVFRPSSSPPTLRSRPLDRCQSEKGMLSIARQARGPCRREAQAARAGLATAVSARQTGRQFLRLLPRAGASTAPAARQLPLPPLLLRAWRDRLSGVAAGGVTSRASRALASSATTPEVDSTGEIGAEGQPEGLGGGAVVGSTPGGWEDGREMKEDGGAFSLPEFGKHAAEEGVDFPAGTAEEEEEENASDAHESDDDDPSAATVTEAGEDADNVLQSQIKDPSMMRLSRRIARSGIASRREAERLVEAGVVTVNGTPVQTPALNVGPRDIVKVKVGLCAARRHGRGAGRTSTPSSSLLSSLVCLVLPSRVSILLAFFFVQNSQQATSILRQTSFQGNC